MPALPTPPPHFVSKKARILQQLAVPEDDYTDASPKGSVDVGIRPLLDEINARDGWVTTSSCAGRVSVFLEGRKSRAPADAPTTSTVAGVGGKGGGGTWLFVSHDPLVSELLPDEGPERDWAEVFRLRVKAGTEGLIDSSDGDGGDGGGGGGDGGESGETRLIHFKFEPMILHVLAASLEHAQLMLGCGMQAGFRESGALNLVGDSLHEQQATPMVAIRSMGLGFESLIGLEAADGQRRCTVSDEYLQSLVQIANERFVENSRRIQRFHEGLARALSQPTEKVDRDGMVWEDAAARRERKRAEGLRRQAELQSRDSSNMTPGS